MRIAKVMSFVDVDGTLPEVMYTILVYLFCGLPPLSHKAKEIFSYSDSLDLGPK